MPKGRYVIDIDSSDRCCGTCKHSVWGDTDGECHGAWWTIQERIYPFGSRTMRPFLIGKEIGTECRLYEPKSLDQEPNERR